MDEPKHFPPYLDPIDVRRVQASLPVFYDESTVLPVNAEKTDVKNRVVFPFLEQRLRQMVADGFPFPADRIDEMIELAGMIKISDYHENEISNRTREPVRAEYDPEFFRIIDGNQEEHHLGLDSRPRTLIHEILHVVSGDKMPSRFYSLDGRTSNGNFVTAEENRARLIAELRPEQIKRMNLIDALDEAITEAATSWIVSDIRYDFSQLTCAQFFAGPGDVKQSEYIEEAAFFRKTLGNMPAGPLIKFAFSNYTSLDDPGQRATAFQEFVDAVDRQIKGGIVGLTHLWELDQELPILFKIQPENLTIPWKLRRALSSKRKKSEEYFEAIDTMTNGWQREQAEFEKEHGTCEIAQGNSSHARLVTEVPKISPEAKERRDETIARAREIYPLRVRTPNTPGASDRNHLTDENTAPESPHLSIND